MIHWYSFVSSLALVISSGVSQYADNSNSNVRYFVGDFNDGEFAFAFDKCQPSFVLQSEAYYQYTCLSETEVKQEVYNGGDTTCSGSVFAEYYYNTSTIVGGQYSGNLYDFNCDEDATDSYAEVEYTISGTCTTSDANFVTAYVAVNVCFQGASLPIVRAFKNDCYKNGDELYFQLNYYDYPSNCNNSYFVKQRNATETCDFMFTSESTGADIYTEVLDCVCLTDECEMFDAAQFGSKVNQWISFGMILMACWSLINL